MHIYWTKKSYPELRDLEPRQREKVWRACWLRPFMHWQTWVAWLCQLLFAVIGAAVGLVIDGWHLFLLGISAKAIEEARLPIFTGILFWVGGMAGAFIFVQTYSYNIRPYLRRYLEAHNVA